jgi:cyanophycinase
MPAQIPPGYTRGPLLFLGAPTGTDATLRQWLWREAGGYGARLVLVTVEAGQVDALRALKAQLVEWECDRVEEIIALDRISARDPAWSVRIDQATGIVLLGEDALRQAALLGGTPLAQAIRRANARSKAVAGLGAAGGFLGQHLIGPGTHPATLRGAVTFAPGLGLVNRLVVDAVHPDAAHDAALADAHQTRLLAAVATNPFLVGVSLVPGSAIILYADNTLTAMGDGPVTVIDGQEITLNELDGPATAAAVEGEILYRLTAGDGFNLDDHSLRPAGEIDLPPSGPITSAF